VNRYKAVTFDMGYTLIHFCPSEEELSLRAFRSLGLDPSPAALRNARDLAWQEYAEDPAHATYEPSLAQDEQREDEVTLLTLKHLGLYEPGLVRPLRAALRAVFDMEGALCPYPEVVRVLETLRAEGYRLGVISNWSWNLEERVRQVGLDRYFDLVLASACAGCQKPHPRIFQQALAALGCLPHEAIHIGDSYRADVIGARGVGMEALWLDREGRGGHDDCRAIRDLNEVLSIVLIGGDA